MWENVEYFFVLIFLGHVSNLGYFDLQGHLVIFENIFVCHSQELLLTLPAWEPEMVGNTVHRTPPQQRITWSIMSILPRLRNSVLKELT